MDHATSRRRAAGPARLGPLLVAAALLACATARPPAAPGELRFPPEEPAAAALDRELAGKGEEELFALAGTAAEAGEDARAAAAYARLADAFPASPRVPAAQLGAGLAYQRLERWRLALERFRARAALDDGPDALEARFGAAECLFHLGEAGDAHAALDALARRPGLPAAARVRALALRGVVELDQGRTEEAERSLGGAVEAWEAAARGAEGIPPYFAAQAEYYLGEAGRGRMRALPLDPSSGDDARLDAELSGKAGALLEAQEHYLRSIRLGDPRWAAAAGLRVGELYEDLRGELLAAPLPPDLDEASAGVYRAELRREVAVLAGKALDAYQQTIDYARRAGLQDPAFLEVAREARARLMRVADDGAAPGR